MFTGIVQALGTVREVRASARDRDLVVQAPPELVARLSLGASVALDGVCQTVTWLGPTAFEVHAIDETLRVTTLGDRRVGDRLNLETALGAGDPLGGHFVQGHVDGVGRIVERQRRGESVTYGIEAPPALVAQLVGKGSVAIDGISLTVGPEPGESRFEVYLIPHTLEVTTLGAKRVGDRVNLETDILGKYVLRYLGGVRPTGKIQWDALARAGYVADGRTGESA